VTRDWAAPSAAESEPSSGDGNQLPLSWTVTPNTHRWLHLLSYGLLAPLGAVALVLVGGAVALGVASIRDGSWAILLALGALAVLALARPPVLAALLSDETEASWEHDYWQPSRLGLVAASTLCAVAMGLALQHSRAAAGAVAVLSFVAALAAMTLSTDASVDDLRLATQHTVVDLSTLSGVRSVTIGAVTVLWLSYARGADSFRNPRVLTVPRERAPQVREALDAGIDADASADPVGHAARAIIAVFGLGVLATGPALWLLVGAAGEERVVLVYLVTFSLVFAGPMLWYAWKG